MKYNVTMITSFARVTLIGTMAACLVAGTTRASMSLTATPSADSFVTPGAGGTLAANNYGAAGALGVSGSSAAKGVFTSVIRFDLAAIKSSFDLTYGVGLWSVQSVTLKLSAADPNNAIFNAQNAGQFSVVWMQNDSWVEGSGTPGTPTGTGITYNSLPGFLGVNDQSLGTFSVSALTDGAATTSTLSVSSGFLSDIQAGGLASIELLAASADVSYLFNSRTIGTVGRRPTLTVTAIPEASQWFIMGIGCVLLALSRRLRHAR